MNYEPRPAPPPFIPAYIGQRGESYGHARLSISFAHSFLYGKVGRRSSPCRQNHESVIETNAKKQKGSCQIQTDPFHSNVATESKSGQNRQTSADKARKANPRLGLSRISHHGRQKTKDNQGTHVTNQDVRHAEFGLKVKRSGTLVGIYIQQ